jgi:hypothetical protein
VAVLIGSQLVPTDEAEIKALIDSGALRERNGLDIKSALATVPAANKELSRDLASFAVEGGLYIVGVAEKPTIQLAKQALAGLKEHVGNVAKDAVRPPLRVDVREVLAAGSASDGYLVVIIPPGPDAPHQADYRYWGRSAAGKVELRHEEVERIRAGRVSVRRDVLELLDETVRTDPVPARVRRNGHLFVVSRPVAGVPRMLRDKLGQQFEGWIKASMINAASSPSRWWPDLRHCWNAEPRMRAWALFGDGFLAGRAVAPAAREGGLLEVIVSDDGDIRLYCGRGSEAGPGDNGLLIGEWIVAGLALRVVEIARAISMEVDFRGDWDIAMALTGVRDARSSLPLEDPLAFRAAFASPFPEDEYRCATRATALEVSSSQLAVVERLTEDLFAVLNRGAFRLRP